jgi:hypothetical protein
MGIRHSEGLSRATRRARTGRRSSRFLLLLWIFPAALIGCATPGEPTQRRVPVPAAISDLAAEQVGNGVVLNFTLPSDSADRHALKRPPSIEIYRDFVSAPPGASAAVPAPSGNEGPAGPPEVSPTLLVTIPAGVVSRYSDRGLVHYSDLLTAEDFAHSDGPFVRYIVRTRASEKKDSSNSNSASLRIYPAANPIDHVEAQVTHTGVILTWTPPQVLSVVPAPLITGYNVYRAEAPSGASASSPQMKSPLVKIGEVTEATYQDMQVEFGDTYVYSVRSLVQHPGKMLESVDSELAVVIARDTFPPAAPQRLVVLFVPARGGTPAYVELSWDISPETDLAGYNVYRSGQAGVQGERLNADLLPAPAFRDLTAAPGRQYFYMVTAVDRSGNESVPSESIPGGVPPEGSVQ